MEYTSFLDNGFIPIIENNGVKMPYTQETLLKTVLSLGEAGVNEIEMADRSEGALEVFQQVNHDLEIQRQSGNKEVPVIGPGTIESAQRAIQYIDEGAKFIIGAFFKSEVADVCHERGVMYIPGVHTPKEAHEAKSHLGVEILKIFPAHTPRHVQALKVVMPAVPMVASWGPSMETVDQWVMTNHADAIVVGGSLVNIGLVDENFDLLKSTVKKLIDTTHDLNKR